MQARKTVSFSLIENTVHHKFNMVFDITGVSIKTKLHKRGTILCTGKGTKYKKYKSYS